MKKRVGTLLIGMMLVLCLTSGSVFGAEAEQPTEAQSLPAAAEEAKQEADKEAVLSGQEEASERQETSDETQEPAGEEESQTPEEQPEVKVTGVIEKDGEQIYVVEDVFEKVTGVVQRVSDGKDVYVEDGFFKPATGVAKRIRDGKEVYVKKGIFKSSTGVAKRISDGKEVYVKSGSFKSVTGLMPGISNAKKKLYVQKGIFQKNLTGVVKLPNKKQVYVQKGVFKKATGIAKRLKDQKRIYVQKGIFKKATGVAKRLSDKKPFYVRKGVFQKFTGLAKQISNQEWVFVKSGALATNPKQFSLTKADAKAGREEILAKVYAKTIFQNITTPKMSKAKKLTVCFDWVADNVKFKLSRIPHYNGYDWPIVYCVDLIRYGGSTCFGYSSLFGYLARMCGYKNVYWCSQSYHGWVEIDGYIYDPVFVHRQSYQKRVFKETYASARAMQLGTDYNNAAYRSNPWMRIQVPEIK